MRNFRPVVAIALLAWATPLFAADDVAAIRAELDALKAAYAERVSALEARIAQLETAANASAATEQVAAAPPPPAPSPPAGNASAAFNPAISMILAGTYSDLSRDPETYRIAGFIPSGGEVGPGERSFNLGESELTVAANVDPYFFANVTAAVTADNEISIEEAYFRTTALHSGFTVKGGRFFSGFGYLNEVHAHAWDFVDQPLIYQAFFGGQLAQDGAQVKWLAPTDLFIELGLELGNGDVFPGTRGHGNGFRNTSGFAHVGGDVVDSWSWRTGVSYVDVKATDRTYEDGLDESSLVRNAFTGNSHTWIADAILKWAPQGDSTRHQLKLQGEYMHRTERGDLAYDIDSVLSELTGDYRSRQSGWYLQGVYQFMPRWRAGLRYDSLDSGSPRIGLVTSGALSAAAFPLLQSASPERTTVMIDWSPSEFSRLRTQYSWDDARGDLHDRQFLIQYLYGIGAHGAHKF